MSLKVIALGSGVCANCCLPGPRRYPPGFLVDYDGHLLLLDASEGVRFRIEDYGYDYGLLSEVAITHTHPDHAALPQLIQAKLCRVLWGAPAEESKKLTVYMHETSVAGFRDVWNWHHPEGDNVYKDKLHWGIEPVRTGWEKEIFPGLKMKAFGVYHGFGQHPAVGYEINAVGKKIVYTGDTGMSESLFGNVEKPDLLISDAGVRIGQEYTAGYGHMGCGQSGMLAYRAQAKELWLTHYVGFDTPAAMEAEARKSGFSGTVKVVTDGLIWEA